jgi:hypothetical protein
MADQSKKVAGSTTTTSRRAALRGILATGGSVLAARSMPEAWTRPVVDIALAPVHAQATTCGSVACGLQISVNWNTDGDDIDLGVSFQGAQVTGKAGAGGIPCLVHGGDVVPPDNLSTDTDFRETISNPSGFLAPGLYRVFVRFIPEDDTGNVQSVSGTIRTTCAGNFPYSAFISTQTSPVSRTVAEFEVESDGNINFL